MDRKPARELSGLGRRIVSLLPSATEMVFALGLGDQLVGVTHECDYPPDALDLPVLVKAVLPVASMSQTEIDEAVTQRLRDGLSLYEIDESLLRALAPNLILTQNLCQVCAPSGNELSRALTQLEDKPDILWMTPHTLAEVLGNIRELGNATGREPAAEMIAADWVMRIRAVADQAAISSRRPRVFCMEWMDPIYCSGHWVPEMVHLAGGCDELGRPGADSVRISWEAVVEWAPEILILMPCGFGLDKAIAQARLLANYPGFYDLPAIKAGRAYAVDANAYFARPGPRLVDGVELLHHLISGRHDWQGCSTAYAKLDKF